MSETLKVNSKRWWDSIVGRWAANGDKRDRPHEFKKVAADIDAGSVLEIGCAVGSFCKYLKPAIQYFGTDISSAMVEIARKEYPRKIFLELDIFNMNLGKWQNAFTHTCAFQVLEHFEMEQFLKFINVCSKVSQVSLYFSVPKGLPTTADRKADGHYIGWNTLNDFAKDVKGFGIINELPCDDTHLMGELVWHN
ncbi:MAG: class I SAM-dependent methyltransferase [Candidatus Peribacteraceae bacterium]|nr:class I SAM-dependent methyltransferase [Candidatus Peribacteraceae bacterium]